jgi:AraC-like DNA-binding protein
VSDEFIKFSQSPAVPGTETVRVERCGRLWRAFHETYTICALVDSAGVDWRRGRECNKAVSGDILFAQPGDLTMSTALVRPHTFVSILIASSTMEEAAGELGMQQKQPTWRAPQISNEWLCQQIIRHHRSLEDGSLLDAECALADCVGLLFQHCIERRAGGTAPVPRANVLRARDYIEDNYQQQLSACELAKAVGASRYHLARSFAEEFGVTPHAYLVQVRLAKAKLLLARDIPVQRVAIEAGFADQSHFTRHFRNTYGATPAQYVRAIRRARPS